MDRLRVRRRHWPSSATGWIVGVGAGLTSVSALASWSLLTDPAVAADVATTGELMPLVQAMYDTLRSALAELIAYL